MNMEEIIRQLKELSAFNKLTQDIVDWFSVENDVDARQICKEHGITYWIN